MRASFHALDGAREPALDEPTPRQVEWARTRGRAPGRTDPAGSWVADADGAVVGRGAGAGPRGRVGALSLLDRRPSRTGSWCLGRAAARQARSPTGPRIAEAGSCLASRRTPCAWADASSGFDRAGRRPRGRRARLLTGEVLRAMSRPRALPRVAGVRALPRPDIERCADRGELLVDPAGARRAPQGTPKLLAAPDDASATRLRPPPACAPEAPRRSQSLTAGQDWAVQVTMAARLRLGSGARCSPAASSARSALPAQRAYL